MLALPGAARTAEIQPFHVMELMARAQELERAGRSVIHMEVGEPDFATAQPILDAAQRFLAGGHVHYTAALGLESLRTAIAEHYQQRYGITVDANRIVVTAGASGALLLALAAVIDPGTECLLADPGYPCNRNFVRLLEGRPVSLPVGPATAYQPSAEQVAAAWNAASRCLLVASPSNPTGTLLSAAQLAALWDAVRRRGGELIVDEIYHGLTYGTDAESAVALSEDIFVINSFSKYYGMTGWRLGWLVVPPRHLRAIEKLAQNLFICPSTVAQHAALAAFRPETLEILEARRIEFSRRRDLLLPRLGAMGFDIAVEPGGAFYIYAGTARLTADSYAFARSMLEECGVAATPGLDFGMHLPQRHIRFAYTTAMPLLEEGLERLEAWLTKAG